MTTMMMMPTSSEAAEEVASKKESSMVAGAEVARRLRGVPTFAIVDGNGVPFATYEKGGASGTGYFFTTIAAAQYVLEDAKKAFQEARLAGRDTEDSWGDSHTVTVSLAVALQLSVKKRINIAQNGNSLTTYYQILPGTSELQLAQRLDKKSARFAERGRVPLFYFPELTLPLENNNNNDSSSSPVAAASLPLFFDPRDLLAEWKKQYSDTTPPPVKVRELTEIFYAMLKPGGENQSVQNMVFMPTSSSLDAVKEIQKNSDNQAVKYKMGQVILTS